MEAISQESTLRVSDATFEKHDYSKPMKRKVKHVGDFDPIPVEFRVSAMSRLPKFPLEVIVCVFQKKVEYLNQYLIYLGHPLS